MCLISRENAGDGLARVSSLEPDVPLAAGVVFEAISIADQEALIIGQPSLELLLEVHILSPLLLGIG